MKPKHCLGALALTGALGFSSMASAQVPIDLLTQQGRLFDSAGAPINDTLDFTFTFYADSDGLTPLWTETQSVALSDGFFSVQLGSVTPFPAGLFDGSLMYLGVQVGSDAEMT
ncbi:MAG: collagen-like protein, partial [Myxococcales bacterium]|nr:collagen-like protein [Myxococcales bacterium]